MSTRFCLLTVLLGLLVCTAVAYSAEKETKDFICGTVHPEVMLQQLREERAALGLPDLNWYAPPQWGPVSHDSITPKTPVAPADFFLYEDVNQVLVNPFGFTSLRSLMVDAANALIARDGDQWDYIAYCLVHEPHAASQIGSAFEYSIINDVAGLGMGFFDSHGALGLSGTNVQSFVMMWNIAGWDADSSDMADYTHLVMGQEFEHRWGMFLPTTDNGLMLQGDDATCGRSSHWHWKVDAQGSGMEAAEWVGSSPSVLDSTQAPALVGGIGLWFNTDIPGGVWSYPDLYLMGYVTPEEMDDSASELRYMDDDCASPYGGGISTFTSANITATAGDRVPDATVAQHSFRTAWIVFYQPGTPPSAGELQRWADLATRWTQTWHYGTLGRGFMDNAILPPFIMATSPSAMAASVNSFDPVSDHFVPSLDTTGFNVQVTDSAGTHDATSGQLNYSVDGAAYQTTPLTSLGGGSYHSVIPALPCEQTVNYYVSFLNSDSSYTITEPLGSSTTPFSAISVRAETLILADDFETDMGWTVGFTGDAATSGIWERVDPIGTGAQPEDDNSSVGTMCYITDQGAPYGDTAEFLGHDDVDGGKTSLISPAFDLSGKNGVVRYARWYSNDAGATPNTDKMTVTISNDNGVTFPETLEVVTENQIGWVTKHFVVNHFITPTSQMKVRFEASDLGSGSLVEAGVDDFEAFAIDVSYTVADVNGTPPISLPDVIHLVNYVFDKDRPATSCLGSDPGNCWTPDPLCRGEINGTTPISLPDVIHLVNYVFDKDRPATSCLGSDPENCWPPVKNGECCL